MSLKSVGAEDLVQELQVAPESSSEGFDQVFNGLLLEMFDTEQSYAEDVEKRFALEQNVKVYKTRLDYYFDLFDRFLEGGRATVFSPNVMKCS